MKVNLQVVVVQFKVERYLNKNILIFILVFAIFN